MVAASARGRGLRVAELESELSGMKLCTQPWDCGANRALALAKPGMPGGDADATAIAVNLEELVLCFLLDSLVL